MLLLRGITCFGGTQEFRTRFESIDLNCREVTHNHLDSYTAYIQLSAEDGTKDLVGIHHQRAIEVLNDSDQPLSSLGSIRGNKGKETRVQL